MITKLTVVLKENLCLWYTTLYYNLYGKQLNNPLNLEKVLCFEMKLSQNFPFALHNFWVVSHQKQPSWKSVSTKQNQAMCEPWIINAFYSRTTVIYGSYSFASQNVTYLLNIVNVLTEVTGLNLNRALERLSQAEGQKWPVSSWRIFSQSNPSGQQSASKTRAQSLTCLTWMDT